MAALGDVVYRCTHLCDHGRVSEEVTRDECPQGNPGRQCGKRTYRGKALEYRIGHQVIGEPSRIITQLLDGLCYLGRFLEVRLLVGRDEDRTRRRGNKKTEFVLRVSRPPPSGG